MMLQGVALRTSAFALQARHETALEDIRQFYDSVVKDLTKANGVLPSATSRYRPKPKRSSNRKIPRIAEIQKTMLPVGQLSAR